ncbi:helix-turn-helix transcriptional regulator [Adlercreutzia shanghongiae]|uniref:helix-turn-helix transcriptional regulator n=1 Tax=Adlercreutzia shanghongiae TaxID=3111773 RepID=UPI002DBD1970|nr:helix-turn-helix transcriptional regulator [Adlercreutzia sp. R25]
MEKSMSTEVEPGQRLNWPLVFTASCGFALYWSSFFTMLMRNSFMDGAIEILWYHLFLRIVFLLGSCIGCLAMAKRADWMSSAQGVRFQKAGVCLFSVVAAVGSLAAYSLSATMPLAFDCAAWGLAGVGLSCLLMLWVELLSAFAPAERDAALVLAIGLGAPAYLVMNLLPFPFNIGLLCASPLISLGIFYLLEQDEDVVASAFVPLEDSLQRARWTASYKGIAVAYGIVFGLGIGSTTQIAESDPLYSGIAVVLALGAAAAWFVARFLGERIQKASSFRFLFPVLIIALIPMAFLQGMPSVACNLLLLGCYVFFEAIGINLALVLAKQQRASRIQLVAVSQACIYLGLALGHGVGLAATSTGAMNYSMLSVAALGLVILLALFITFAPLSPLAGHELKNAATLEADVAVTEKDAVGFWRKHCERIAQEAGLSARETEVFLLLAKGRGIEHIQNKLNISSHTVKTHTYNIYRKMGIGSREELLDLVETDVDNGGQS